jgi:hypothetical protein
VKGCLDRGCTPPRGRAEHCTVCHETFTGSEAGDWHRTGAHGVTTGPERRRCLTVAEMLALGMTRTAAGLWQRGDAGRKTPRTPPHWLAGSNLRPSQPVGVVE